MKQLSSIIITLSVQFSVLMQQTAYCPNHNYILVLNGTSNESTWQHEISTPTLVPGETKINNIKAAKISIDYLTDNTILKFSILVTNNMTEDMYTATIGKDICKYYTRKVVIFVK